MRTTRIAIALAAFTVSVAGAPAAALQNDGTVVLGMAPPPGPNDRAVALREQAESLFDSPKQWKRAVKLLEQSAALRDASDPEAYTCLLYAGRIRAALGDADGAREALVKAAEHALARGQVMDAANAFIDAAHAAVAGQDGRGAQELIARARLLSDSPALTVSQRTSIRSRIPV